MQDRLSLKLVVVSAAKSLGLRHGTAARQRDNVFVGVKETASETPDRSITCCS